MTPRDGWNWVLFTLASTSYFSDPMFQLESEHVISENPNVIPRIGDFWILVTLFVGRRSTFL
jgi:hypothetical protein